MRIALGVEYDGSAFRGWQTQPAGETVQDALEAAMAQIAGERVNVVCAGRTDAGVHARMQTASFRAKTDLPAPELLRRLRASARFAELPVVMATAKGAEYDKIQGLDLDRKSVV